MAFVVLIGLCIAMTAELAHCMASLPALCCACWATSPRTRLRPSTLCLALRASPGLDLEVSGVLKKVAKDAAEMLQHSHSLVSVLRHWPVVHINIVLPKYCCIHCKHLFWCFCCCTLLVRGACLQVPTCQACQEQHPSPLRSRPLCKVAATGTVCGADKKCNRLLCTEH